MAALSLKKGHFFNSFYEISDTYCGPTPFIFKLSKVKGENDGLSGLGRNQEQHVDGSSKISDD
jgi:hypothetical protein